MGVLSWWGPDFSHFERYGSFYSSHKHYTRYAGGGFISAGLNYMFSKHVGIFLNVQSLLGTIKDDDGYTRNPAGFGSTIGLSFRL